MDVSTRVGVRFIAEPLVIQGRQVDLPDQGEPMKRDTKTPAPDEMLTVEDVALNPNLLNLPRPQRGNPRLDAWVEDIYRRARSGS